MKIFRASLLSVVVGSLVSAGCGASMSVISHEKQAYVVRQKALGFSSDMYFCNAAAGKPVCTAVTEAE
jgi:hypothetical protein